jgi:hypothetical protein
MTLAGRVKKRLESVLESVLVLVLDDGSPSSVTGYRSTNRAPFPRSSTTKAMPVTWNGDDSDNA